MYKYIIILLCIVLTSCSTMPMGEERNNELIISVPSTFVPKTIPEWTHLRYLMLSTKAKTITLLWEGRGGWFIVGEPFKRAIREAKLAGKTVIFKVIGPALSLHAYMVCEGSKIEYTSNALLMFHVAADVYTGKIDLDKTATDEVMGMINVCYNKGILTSVDINNIISVHEVWIDSNGNREVLKDRRQR